MSELRKLTEQEITDKLQALPEWQRKDGKLHREHILLPVFQMR